MPSAWITARMTKDGKQRFRVMYRVGGRESSPRYGGSFTTHREAKTRKNWIAGELAAMRVPNLELVTPTPTVTLRDVAERWRLSRVDVSAGTATTHQVNLGRIVPVLGAKPVDKITPADVADLVAQMHGDGLARETIRKTRATLAMVLDHASVQPNPARDKTVKLPREDAVEVNPPTAPHVLAVHRLLPKVYRLPTLVLDATGMRVGE